VGQAAQLSKTSGGRARTEVPDRVELTATRPRQKIAATDNQLRWDTGDVAPGESRSIDFDTAGTYTFTCTPHPWMLGQIVVQ
jgi:plastocyanin